MVTTALNHMAVPTLGYDAVLRLAQALGCVGVEFRNDLPGPLFGGTDPAQVGEEARAMDLRILALAEVKTFNAWSDEVAASAANLMTIAGAAGAEAISLIPANDGRTTDLNRALQSLAPMLDEAGLIGLIEPLGFVTATLRFKQEVVETLDALGLTDRFKLIHDSFHHHLAGDGPIYPQHTGLVHISGVTDQSLAVSDMRDSHRGLVDADDRLGTLDQIAALRAGGYSGPISVEPFAPEVHTLADPRAALAQSFAFIQSRLSPAAA